MSWAIWITGATGIGTSSIAWLAAREIRARGGRVHLLDLDAVRRFLAWRGSQQPGGPLADLPPVTHAGALAPGLQRALIRVAVELTAARVPVIIAAPATPRPPRDFARTVLPAFAEVEVVGTGDPALAYPYEPPIAPELRIDASTTGIEEGAARVAALSDVLGGCRVVGARCPTPASSWVLWITGVPGSGKTTLAATVADALSARGIVPHIVDETSVMSFVVAGARSTPADRELSTLALIAAAAELADAGVPVVVDASGPRRAWRQLARERIAHFAEAQLVCHLGTARDRERAVRWHLAGCGSPARPGSAASDAPDIGLDYEYSLRPEITVRTDAMDVGTAAGEIVRLAETLAHQAAIAARTHGLAPATKESVMQVHELMSRTLITARPETTVTEARAVMATEQIRHLLVTDAGRLVGMVTDRDIRLNLASPATSLSIWELNYLLARLRIGEVMTRSLIVVEPTRDARDAARLMLDHRIGALPVLEGERLVGILTETDLVRAFAETLEPAAAR